MRYLIVVVTLFCIPNCFAAKSYKELAQEYARAYLAEDVNGIIKLRYSAWEQCVESEFNALLRNRTNAINFDSKKFYKDYRLELKEISKRPDGEAFGFFEEVGQIEYYPVKPTHSIYFWAKEGGMASMPIAKIAGKWYTLHTCAGKDAGKFLELEKQFFEE